MELSKKNNFWLFCHRYLLGDGRSTPNNLCTLFWSGLAGMVFLLPSIPFFIWRGILRIFNRRVSLYQTGGGLLIIFYEGLAAIIYLASLGVITKIIDAESIFDMVWWWWILAPVLFYGSIVLILAIIFGAVWVFDDEGAGWGEAIGNSVVVQGPISMFKRICPRVTWKEDETNEGI